MNLNTKLCCFTIVLVVLKISVIAQSNGESLFLQNCRACHTVGEGKLVGPDLNQITNKRSMEWLDRFIKSSQTLVNANDADAVAIFNEFNKIVMPDQNLTSAQIRSILDYINSKSTDQTASSTPKEKFTLRNTREFKIPDLSKEDFDKGRNYFLGNLRFANGGPSCFSCHNVNDKNLLGGGLLALDLSTAFTRLRGEAAVSAIISNPPFPAMNTAYLNKNLTPDEIFYLTAYLYQADKNAVMQAGVNNKQIFLNVGLIASISLFGIYGLLWWNRKKKSVNLDIYKRQIKTK